VEDIVLISGFPAGPWGTNFFVLAPAPGSECLIVDPGQGCGPQIREILAENKLLPVAVLLTHGHIDHVWSVAPLTSDYGIPAYIHPEDRYRLADPIGNTYAMSREQLLSMTSGELELTDPQDVRTLDDGQMLDIAGLTLRVAHAPGHTEGSAVFEIPREHEQAPIVLTGDVLFEGTIGRTDFPGGSMQAMERSLRNVILPMDDDCVVLPGHGARTTIGRERATNPYLLEILAGGTIVPPRRGV
jgi:glyoxylase-like metal-dependent hydrolase (beta-lactamase superfamily II)